MLELPLRFNSMVDLLAHRAREQGGDRAFVFVSDQGEEESVLTFGGLLERATALANRLRQSGATGDRALLLFPAGLEFIVAYFGCLLAGVIAVPMMLPRRNARDDSANIVRNCAPRFVLANRTVRETRPDIVERFAHAGLEWVVPDPAWNASTPEHLPERARADIAFLQYTSGSTSEPKGVMVTHGNLLDNLEMIRLALGNTRQSNYVSWVPLYHDMGLILNVLQTIYLGSLCVLLAPVTFMQRPWIWLRSIDKYRAEVAGGPNFAFDLCVQRYRAEQVKDLDLSCWKLAFNAAEPVRADTIDRFSEKFAAHGFDPRAVHPLYGMAEATVLVSSGRRGSGPVMRRVDRAALQAQRIAAPVVGQHDQRLVGCGRNIAGQHLAVVDPETRRRLGTDCIGEIWVHGSHVCQGYWQNEDATRAAFRGCIEGEDATAWLRTGDLGFVDANGELFITGRIKDVIIVRGNNHYPQDIENTVQDAHPALRRHCGAAFSVIAPDQRERVVFVQELERTHRRTAEVEGIKDSIREAVVTEHDLALDEIILIWPGTIPKTTSGKIQRSMVRKLWLAGELDTVG